MATMIEEVQLLVDRKMAGCDNVASGNCGHGSSRKWFENENLSKGKLFGWSACRRRFVCAEKWPKRW